MDDTIDTLKIVISADTAPAKRGVDSFSKSLDKLSAKATSSAVPLQSLLANLSSIATLNFAGVTGYLDGLTNALRTINKEAVKTARIADKLNGSPSIAPAAPKAMDSASSLVDKYGYPFNQPSTQSTTDLLDKTGEALKPASTVDMSPTIQGSDEATASVQRCTEAVKDSVKWFEEQEKAADKAATAVSGDADEEDKSQSDSDDDKKGVSKFTKFFAALKRIFLYRLIRAVIKNIANTIKTGIDNLVIYDEKLNASLSSVKSSFLYLTNSIGASFAPVIEAFSPAINSLLTTLGDFNNTLAETFAIMNGATSFTKATMTVEDYAESLKRAKTQASGFDELNVLTNSNNENMFTTEQIDTGSDFYKIVKGIGEMFKTVFNLVKTLGTSVFTSIINLAEKLGPLLESILTSIVDALNVIVPIVTELLDFIVEFLGPILDALATFITDTELPITEILKEIFDIIFALFNECGSSLSELVANLINLIDNLLSPLLNIIAAILPILKPIFEFLGIAINTILTILNPILDLINEILKDVGTELVEEIRFIMPLVSTILQAITDLVKPFFDEFGEYFGGIFAFIKQIYDVFSPIIKTIEQTIRNVLAPVFDWIETYINSFVKVVKDVMGIIHSFLTGDWDALKNYWSDICDTMKNLWHHLWVDIGNFFVAIINGIIDGFQAFVNFFVHAINGITSGLSKVWSWLGIPEIPQLGDVQLNHLDPIAYANGGFPEDGFFFANSGEMVGQFSNGKTAVANNSEIIEGIRQGVLSAFKEAQGDSNGQQIIVQIDGEEVASKIKKESAQVGPLIYAGGVV